MALQHFYSRVSAKVSMFNRADGFDTFACSEELNEDRINADLSCVYNNKPNKDELALIRDGKLPPVYFGFTGKTGGYVQSCMSFLPLDYTGERSSYLVHSLLLSKEEEKTALHSAENNVLNKDLFVNNLDGFDITSFSATADGKYPTLEYKPSKSNGTKGITEKYDCDMLKRLIFATLGIACGKGKNVYFSLCDNLSAASERTLEFLNDFLQIFPYCIRKNVSFATYTPDSVKFGDFKIKGVLESVGDIPSSKGIVLHFRQKICLGLLDDAVVKEKFTVDFFYNMLEDDKLRREFLEYTESVYEKMPELSKMNMKSLGDLILLFCQCSGRYNEREILPNDDAVHNFLTTYEKYRNALSDGFRANAMLPFRRYPAAHSQIPSKTFTKIVKMYAGETEKSRMNIMGVMLDLIHTDAMRAKLFNFLNTSYETESEEIKVQITENLCRVYYGGFLRPQILEFFDRIFEGSAEKIRDNIFEKILLTVRTDGIREQIFDFINKYYGIFTKEQKDKLFLTFCEILPDGDGLAADFAAVMDPLLSADSDACHDFDKPFCDAVEREQKRREQPLLALVCGGKYRYLYRTLCEKVMGEWSKRVIFERFIDALWNGAPETAVQNIITVYDTVGEVDAATEQKILRKGEERFRELRGKISVVKLIALESFVEEKLSKTHIFDELLNSVLHTAIVENIDSAFFVEGGIQAVEEYSRANTFVVSTPEYINVKCYMILESALKSCDVVSFFQNLCSVKGESLKKAMIKLLNDSFGEAATLDNVKSGIALSLAPLTLKQGEVGIPAVFDTARKAIPNVTTVPSEREEGFFAYSRALNMLVSCADALLLNTDADKKEDTVGRLSGVGKVVNNFKTKYKKSAERYIADQQKTDFAGVDAALTKMLSSVPPSAQKESFFSKLFKK